MNNYNMNTEQKLIAMIMKVPTITVENNTTEDLFIDNKNKNIHNMIKNMIESDEFVSRDSLISKLSGVRDYITFIYEQSIDMREFNAIYSIQKRNAVNYKISGAINELSHIVSKDGSAEDTEASAFSVMDRAVSTSKGDEDGMFTFDTGLKNFFENLTKEANSVKTGIKALDDLASGMYDPGEISAIFGLSGSGKTVFMQQLIVESALDNKKSCFVSIEMPENQLMNRFISAVSNVKHDNIAKKRLTKKDIEKITSIDEETLKAFRENIIFYDRGGCKVEQLRGIIRNSRRKLGGLDIVFIDFLQIIGTMKSTGGRVEEIEYIVNELKAIAKEMKVAIVFLAQINREATSGANKRPEMTHIKGSSAIENLCSLMISIHREESFNKSDNMPLKGLVEFNIKKNRHGPANELIVAKCDLEYYRFSEIEDKNEHEKTKEAVYKYIENLKSKK